MPKTESSDGAINIGVTEAGVVVMDFGQSIVSLEMTRSAAIKVARALLGAAQAKWTDLHDQN